MRLLLEHVPPGATKDEIARLLLENPSLRLLAVSLLTASALGVQPAVARETGEAMELLDPSGELQLRITRGSINSDAHEYAQPVLTFDDQVYLAEPLSRRSWMPTSIDSLVELVSFAEHADGLVLLPPDMRRSRLQRYSELIGLPQDVIVRFMTLAITKV